MRIILLPLAAGLALLPGCARTPAETAAAAQAQQATQDKLAKALAGLTPGKPESCLPYATGSSQSTAYGATILYKVSNGLTYRNDTTGGCEAMARGDILVTVSHQGRPCQGDIARTVDNTSRFQTGSCALGQFVPYRRVK